MGSGSRLYRQRRPVAACGVAHAASSSRAVSAPEYSSRRAGSSKLGALRPRHGWPRSPRFILLRHHVVLFARRLSGVFLRSDDGELPTRQPFTPRRAAVWSRPYQALSVRWIGVWLLITCLPVAAQLRVPAGYAGTWTGMVRKLQISAHTVP